MNRYEEKQERRRERLENAADRASAEARARFSAARIVADGIPMGQPILVGHHSEKRHRRDIARIDTNMRKGCEAEDRAAELRGAAASVGTGGISSDDPDAVAKLRAELAPLVKSQEIMRAANAAIRKHAKAGADAQVAALVALGLHEKRARDLLSPDFAGRIGFADYQLKNNGANIRRIEARIAELETMAATPERAPIVGEGWRIVESREDNRVRVIFEGVPDAATRERLKSRGFRWAPSEGAWQRHASNGAWHAAQQCVRVDSEVSR